MAIFRGLSLYLDDAMVSIKLRFELSEIPMSKEYFEFNKLYDSERQRRNAVFMPELTHKFI